MNSEPSGKSILVIDDDEFIRKIVVQALQLGGHSVSSVWGRTEILRMLEHRHFDLVITDIIMPELDGIEVMREVKKHQPNAALIAMSGGGQYMTREDCLDITESFGVAAILRKPLKLEALLNAVDRAFDSREKKPTY